MMTSKYCMSLLKEKGVFHIDGTYKITSHGYPLIFFGEKKQKYNIII
jgi:hypothetical protein